MLGIGAIQRVKENARGDGKGYFSVAVQHRTTGCSKGAASGNIKHFRADAQTTTATPALGPAPDIHPGLLMLLSQRFGAAFWMG